MRNGQYDVVADTCVCHKIEVGHTMSVLPLEGNTMARSDLLLSLVKSGVRGDGELFRRTVEAIVAEENSKQHHVLAKELTRELKAEPQINRQMSAVTPNGSGQSMLVHREPQRSLDSLVLSQTVRSSILQFVEEQQRADLLRSYNLEPRHRVMLTGPPGNGKTSVAEAIATALSVPFLTARYDALIGSYLGETAVRGATTVRLRKKPTMCHLF